MKLVRIALFLLVLAGSALASIGRIYPQFGIESIAGSNHLLLVTPWVGGRVNLSGSTSFILKYRNHNIRFTYQRFNEDTQEFEDVQRKANLSNFTAVVYHEKKQVTAYAAASYFLGTDSYRAMALDAGVGYQLNNRAYLEVGTYLLREKSILWYPDEPERWINLYSVKAAFRYKLLKGVYFNPNLYYARNSEKVSALSYSLGLIIIPKDPISLEVYYFRYSEAAQYRFAGNYIMAGLNFYY